MTALNVALSATLRGDLSQAGVYAYAVYFQPDGTAVWTTLVDNGIPATGGSATIQLPNPTIAGKVYLTIQSTDQPGTLPQVITSQSMLNDQNAAAYDFRYDSVELTLQNSSSDVANLTSVTGFGIPMEISVPYDDGTTGTVGYGISAAALVGQVRSIDPGKTYTQDYTSGPLAGQFRTAISPASQGQSGSPFQPADWADYVSSLEGSAAQGVVLSGFFNGAVDASHVWHNGGYFAYALQWDAAAQVFWLAPLAGSQVKGFIQVTPADLENSIYATDGNARIYASKTDPAPFLTMNTGANNQWGKVLLTLLTGFTGGFYERTGRSPNPQVTAPVDLDQNINWNPTYAFGNGASQALPYQSFDPYSKIFFDQTNSYGSGYSDALASQYDTGGPQISVSQPDDGHANVPTIGVTLFADGEQPAGYVKPTLNDYIAPSSAGYVAAQPSTAGLNIALVFAEALQNSVGVVLDRTATVSLRLLISDGGGTPVWSTVQLDGSKAGADGLWQIWTIGGNPSSGYTAAPPANPVAQPVGTLLVSGLPAGQDGMGWYQVVVGDKAFNLYATLSGGRFENPGYAGQAGALAVDGLARIAAPAVADRTVTTFSVLFFNSDTSTVDPSLLQVNTSVHAVEAAFGGTLPDAPVAGTLSGGTFTALPGQAQPDANTITTSQATVAFGWTGKNDASGTAGWVSGYTNKIGAGDVARVTVSSGGTPVQTLTATGNLDGEWQTGAVSLGSGTYSVTVQEFLPGDSAFTNPLSPASHALTLIEQPPAEEVACYAAGTRIATPGGETAVELLRAGDLVLTADGRAEAVRWVGRRSYSGRHLAFRADRLPVTFRAGALDGHLPRRDLMVSPEHAMFIDGVLVAAKLLVNGTTIRQERSLDRVDYFHVELDSHDVLLAEGAPSESFVDDDSRGMFDNARDWERMHPGRVRVSAVFCAPRVDSGPVLEAIRRRLDYVRSESIHLIPRHPDPGHGFVHPLAVLAGRLPAAPPVPPPGHTSRPAPW